MFVYSVYKHFLGCHFDVSIEMIEDNKCLYSVDTPNWIFLLYKINDILKESLFIDIKKPHKNLRKVFFVVKNSFPILTRGIEKFLA